MADDSVKPSVSPVISFYPEPSPGGLLPQVKTMILEKQTSNFWLSISKPLSKR